MKQITGTDVARAAGVSQATVSRVMSSDGKVGQDTRRRVLQVARELGYDMASSSGGWTVGVLTGFTPDNSKGYYSDLFAAVFQELDRRGLRMELIWRDLGGDSDLRLFRGLLVLAHPKLAKLQPAFPLPIVWINGHSCRSHNICNVSSDSAAGTAMAVRHLWKRGHRDIRFVSLEGPRAEQAKETHRWQGFLDAMRGHGVESPEEKAIFFEDEMKTNQRKLTSAIRRAVDQGCTALICVNSLHTLKINAALHALHLRVPETLSLIDWEFGEVSAYLDPPRTTMATDFEELARVAVDQLCDMVENHKPPKDHLVRPKLIYRRSVRKRSLA
jgi:LacI family transcriptional regulator